MLVYLVIEENPSYKWFVVLKVFSSEEDARKFLDNTVLLRNNNLDKDEEYRILKKEDETATYRDSGSHSIYIATKTVY